MIQYEKEFLQNRIFLFPVQKDKRPYAGFEWRKLSSKDPKDWQAWEQKYPNCAWAIDCDKSGLCVIDIDPRNGGDLTWEDMRCDFPQDLPDTLQVKTPSGGTHFYFQGKYPKSRLGIGIDFQGAGSYVLCPPSPKYEIITEFVIAPLPSWLCPKNENQNLSRLRQRPQLEPNERVKEGTRDEDLFTECCWAYLKDKLSVDELVRHAIAFDVEHYGLGETVARRKAKSVTERFERTGEEKVDPHYLPLNDYGNAIRLWNWFSEEFIYTNLGWHEWNAKVWEGNAEGRILTRSAEKFQELKKESKKREAAATDETARKIVQECTKFFNQCCNLARLKNMITISQQLFFQDEKILDANPDLLNFENGTVELRTGTLRLHNRGDYITKSTGYALDIDKDCPTFKRLICDAMGQDDAKTLFLIQILGSSLSGNVKDEIILLNHGAGSNGKSTLFGHVMLKVMGDYGRTVNVKSFLDSNAARDTRPRPDLVTLFGVRYATMSEPPVGASFDEALLKSFTAGEPVSCRDLHKPEISFNPTLHLFMSYNLEPHLKDFSDGMRRRLKKLEWGVQFQKNEAFKTSLDAEIPAIANFLVKTCQAWYEHGLEIPEIVTKATDNYFYDENPVAQFVDQYLDICDGTSLSNADLWTTWEQACEQEGWDAKSKRYLSQNLKTLGFVQDRTSKKRRWERLSVQNRTLGSQKMTD